MESEKRRKSSDENSCSGHLKTGIFVEKQMIERFGRPVQNACWVPPVTAICNFYGQKVSSLDVIRDASKFSHVRVGDKRKTNYEVEDEGCDAVELLFSAFKIPSSRVFSDSHIGTSSVSEKWWKALKECIDSDNVALLWLERKELSEKRKHAKSGAGDSTHYLIVTGYQERKGRRNSTTHILIIKDPMEGDDEHEGTLEAVFEMKKREEMVLTVSLKKGGKDRYCNFWCYFFDRNLVSNPNVHFAYCDVCYFAINGKRYNCLENCAYDECEECYNNRKSDGKSFEQVGVMDPFCENDECAFCQRILKDKSKF